MKKEKLLCCICGQPIVKEGCPNYFGNNPAGAMWRDMNGNICEPTFNTDARCCDVCNDKFVIPGRMYKLFQMRMQNKEGE